MLTITVEERAWPLLRPFTISRGTRDVARTIVVTLSDAEGRTGMGEAVPYPRHGETVEETIAELERAAPSIAGGVSHDDIPRILSGKAARNALDCALWDLEAARTGRPVWQLAGLPRLHDQSRQPRGHGGSGTAELRAPPSEAQAGFRCRRRRHAPAGGAHGRSPCPHHR